MSTWTVAGKGEYVSGSEPVIGTVVEIKTTEDVLALFDGAPDDMIVLLHTSGGTILSPLFDDLKAVISTVGSKGSHVAILSREFGIPCVMGAALGEGVDIKGKSVRIDTDGTLHIES